MKPNENIFIEKLSNYSESELLTWAHNYYTGKNFDFDVPFETAGDPMTVLERTFGLLNNKRDSKGNYLNVLYRFEEVLAVLLAEEGNRRFINPAIVWRFISIFTQCPPRGFARGKLVSFLNPIINQESWRNIRIGNRDLHYDALELFITLAETRENSFRYESIGNDLLTKIEKEQSTRFSSIVLRYFRNTYNITKFFDAFDLSFDLLPIEKITSLSGGMKILYRQYSSLSFSYFANWLAIKSILLHNQREKLAKISEEMFPIILERWEERRDMYLGSNRAEGRFIIALIVLITSYYFPFKISPKLTILFIQNESFGRTKDNLMQTFQRLQQDNWKSLLRIINNYDTDKEMYYTKVHISTIISLVELLNGNIEQFDNFDDEPKHYYIDIDYINNLFVINNDNESILKANYLWKDAVTTNESIELSNYDAFNFWKNTIEQMLIEQSDSVSLNY